MSIGKVWACLFLLWIMIDGQAIAVVVQQQTPEQHIETARAAIEKKKYKDAEKELKKALSLKKDSPEANLLLGLVYRSKDDFDKAFKHVREAIRLLPNYPDAHYVLAYLYVNKNQLNEAAEEIKLALDQGARSRNIYMLKANLEIRSSKFDEALKSYETALQLYQPSDEGYQGLSEQIESLKSYIAFQPLKDEFRKHKDDPAYKMPLLKNRPQPLYNRLAREKKIQGTVYTAVRVDEQGKPGTTHIVQGLGYGLDEQAIKAVSEMRFSPAMRNGEPVKFWLTILIEFNIR